MISAERLRELLSYDAAAGPFRWRRTVSSTAVAGSEAGSRHTFGYITIRIDGRRYLAHRLAWLYQTGDWPAGHIDHINRQPSDNRFSNLRLATNAQNSFNGSGPAPGQSGFRGVVWHARDRVWQARIRHNGRRLTLGTYHSAIEAAKAYDDGARLYHGEFATLNFSTGEPK